MGCRNISKRMPQYVQGLLSAEDARGIDDHVRACDSCRKELAGLQETWEALDGLPAPDDAPSMAPEVMRRIDDYERRRAGTLRAWLAPFRFSFAGAAAISMLFCFVSGAFISAAYYPDNGQPQTAEDSAYGGILSDSPQSSFIDLYLPTADKNSEENSL
jgi:anti-sigma factor RsiW